MKVGEAEKNYSLDLQLVRFDKSTFYAYINCLQIKSTDGQQVLRITVTNISQLKA